MPNISAEIKFENNKSVIANFATTLKGEQL